MSVENGHFAAQEIAFEAAIVPSAVMGNEVALLQVEEAEYTSPAAGIVEIPATMATRGGDGSSTDTQRMSWKDRDDDDDDK